MHFFGSGDTPSAREPKASACRSDDDELQGVADRLDSLARAQSVPTVPTVLRVVR